jgi:hypothetical protein
LVITSEDEPEITGPQHRSRAVHLSPIYLLLHNEKIRDVIDTIGKKAVLILGRFTDERKVETVSLLARMARFIIAGLTHPRGAGGYRSSPCRARSAADGRCRIW